MKCHSKREDFLELIKPHFALHNSCVDRNGKVFFSGHVATSRPFSLHTFQRWERVWLLGDTECQTLRSYELLLNSLDKCFQTLGSGGVWNLRSRRQTTCSRLQFSIDWASAGQVVGSLGLLSRFIPTKDAGSLSVLTWSAEGPPHLSVVPEGP